MEHPWGREGGISVRNGGAGQIFKKPLGYLFCLGALWVSGRALLCGDSDKLSKVSFPPSPHVLLEMAMGVNSPVCFLSIWDKH